MNAALKSIAARCIERPSYGHWNLVQTNDKAAWILANWEAIKIRFRSFGTTASDDCTLQEYALNQWEMERAHRDELREDAKRDRDEYTTENAIEWGEG